MKVNTVIKFRDTEFYHNRFTLIPSINDMVESIRNNNESSKPLEPSK